MNKHLSVRISDDLNRKIEECAQLLRVKPSDVVRRILEMQIDKEIEAIKKLNSQV
jgi:predicted transcriptional regulator